MLFKHLLTVFSKFSKIKIITMNKKEKKRKNPLKPWIKDLENSVLSLPS